jgi:hypothetical protein
VIRRSHTWWATSLVSALLFFFSLSLLAQSAPKGGPQGRTEEVTVYFTKTGTKYHREGCRHLSKSKRPMSLKDAKARDFTPCKVCKPPG